jgi:subtilisin-like proprotein convertase family protein
MKIYHTRLFRTLLETKKEKSFSRVKIEKTFVFFFFLISTFISYSQVVTVPAANTNSGSVNDPFGTYWGFERSAMVYTSAQIGATTGNITSVGFYLNSSATPGDVTNCRIYMKTRTNLFTANTGYATETTGATLVYGPTTIPAASFSASGWVTVNLSTPFNYSGGTNNLEIIIETNATATGNEGSTAKQFRYATQGNIQYYQYWNADNTAPAGNGTRSTTRPNVQLTFASTTACSGTPTPGNTLSSSTSVLSGGTVNLSLQNFTSGTGVTYQWQSASTSSGPWGNISGATSSTYAATVTANTWYQCIVNCSTGSTSGSSSPVQVTLISPPGNDVCASATSLPCGTLNLAGTTVNTVSETAPGGGGLASPFGVWYSFTGNGQQTTLSTTGTGGFDQEMTIVSGTCGSTVLISTQDVGGTNGTENYTFGTTNGVTYYVYVAHWNSTGTAANVGTFTISRTCSAPDWTDAWVSMNTGSSNWCAGETRTISVTVTNTGSSTWTNATPDINIGVKWNAEADYFIRTDANDLAPGATQTYNLTVTAPMTAGPNNLTFDIVNEANFWFANNTNGGGPGNTVYTSPAITINNSPIVNAGIDQTICIGQNATLNGQVLSNSTASSSSAVAIPDVDPLGASTTLIVSGASVSASQISGVAVNITHTWDSDLSLTLIAPNGSSIDLSSGNGGSGDNYSNTYFTSSGSSITLGASPFTGSFTPEVSLSTLTGTANGTWTLLVIDNASGDVGTINSWSITYGEVAPSATYSWSPAVTLSNSLIANPVATPSTSTTYTLTGALNGCSATDDVLLTLPTAGSSLAQDNEDATCVVNQNGWVHFYHSSGRLIASINSQGQDLGLVTATSYVEGAPVLVDACASSNPIFTTSVMGRHWVITPSNQPSSAVLVRLPYENTEFSSLSSAASTNFNPNDDLLTTADLGLSKYSNGANTNVNDIATDNCGVGTTTFHAQLGNGLTATYSSVAANYVDFSIPSFSEFWLHGSAQSSPLPVELINFQANCKGEGKVDVTWATASEHNSASFTIEKSRDGINWTVLTSLASAGNSTQLINYSTVDNNAAAGVNYYRLTQTDFDGASETFNIASANCGENSTLGTVKVYPNPSAGDFYIDFTSEEITGASAITIKDARGMDVYKMNVTVEKGNNIFHIDNMEAAPGMYYIQVSNGTATSSIVKHSLR